MTNLCMRENTNCSGKFKSFNENQIKEPVQQKLHDTKSIVKNQF